MRQKKVIKIIGLVCALFASASFAKEPIEPAQTQALNPDQEINAAPVQDDNPETNLVNSDIDNDSIFNKLPEQVAEEEFQPSSLTANLEDVVAPEPPASEDYNFQVAQTAANEAPAAADEQAVAYEVLPAEPVEQDVPSNTVAANLEDVVAPEPPASEDFNFRVAQQPTTPEPEVAVEPLSAPATSELATTNQPEATQDTLTQPEVDTVTTVKSAETQARAEPIQVAEMTKAVESARSVETTQAVESPQALETTQAVATNQAVESSQLAENAKPVETSKPTEPAKSVEIVNKVEAQPSVAEKALEVLKETLKSENESKAKIKDEKQAQAKPFPKDEVLTLELENPKKFNGLPNKAIEKVPGLAKDKSATFITLKEAVQTAVVTNPEVLQSYKNFEGAVKDADAAWGRYLPSVDLNAFYGQENRNDPLVSRDRGRLGAAFVRSQASLSVRQMLFDGFFTKTEVERLSRTSRARLFELEEQSNAVALETVKAYTDLLRFRRLTELSEENYVNHKVIYEQLVIKAKAGVGKKSDVEQAKSRLSLAEYNMTVEGSNLHDIEARFQKVVGFIPPEEVDQGTPVNKEIPQETKLAINKAQFTNPKLLATIEDAFSQQALLDNKDAAFMPKVDLRMRADRGNDLNSFDGYHGNDVAEVVVSWNLFNGNSDVNFKKKERALLEAAVNRRDKFCRDIRLELEIAYNDIKKLTEQYNYLDARTISIEKARDAYRKQFEIGQRTLIDLLNTENELYEAKRLLTNIQNDLSYAYARTHYQMGTLLAILDVTRYASTTTAPRPSSLSELGSNIAVCPAEAPTPYKANKKNLDSRANEFLNTPKEGASAPSETLNKDFKEMTQ